MWFTLAGSLFLLPIKKTLALLLLVITLVWALYSGVLLGPGLAYLLVFTVLACLLWRYRSLSRFAAIVGELLLLLAAAALFVHQVPGFNNPKILNQVIAGPHSAPFSMYFNLDKALIPFLLVAALPSLWRTKTGVKGRNWQWILLILSIPALLLLAVALGGLRIEAHWPQWIGSFMLANLFFVSLAEEALFRGYLQQRVSQWLGNWPALVLVSVVFGLAHLPGGLLMVIFSLLAGLIYGLAWMLSGRLWVATLFHFALNLCHLLLFTYPIYRA